MSSTTPRTTHAEVAAPPAGRPPATPRPPVVRTLLWLLPTNLVVAAWGAAVLLVLWAGAVVVAAAVTGGDLGTSIAQHSRQGTVWFPFSMAVTVFAGYHVAHIAAGMTRRVLGRATLVLVGVMTIAYSGIVALLFALELVVYRANGWEQGITEQGWFTASPPDLVVVVLLHAVVVAAAQVSGLLVAVVYQRAGGWWGTLALPLTVGPLLVVMMLTGSDWELGGLPTAVRVVIGLAVIAAMAAAYLREVRRVALRPVRT